MEPIQPVADAIVARPNPPLPLRAPDGDPASSRPRPSKRAVGMTVLVVAMLLLATIVWRPSWLPFAEQSATGTTLSGSFLYQQQRALSCEFASVHIATVMLGSPVSEYTFDDLVGVNENPHLGYRGDIHGVWGNTDDYGIYNEPLATALTGLGFTADAFYADGDRDMLTDALDAGMPTVVWLAMRGDVNSFDVWDANGDRYQLTQWMHVMLAYGYDEEGVYLTDPGTAVYRFYAWDEFMGMWNVMDGMGLSIGLSAD